MLHPIHHTLATLLFIGCSFYTIGQSIPQKPRWDRRTSYQLTIKQLSVDAQTWTDQSGLTITEFQRTGPDSVVLYQQDQQIGTFLAEKNRIYSPRFVMKDEKGVILWIDSFRVAEQIYLRTYLANYKAALASHWTFYHNGMPSTVNYKDLHGDDSLSLHWSELGILRLKKQENREYHYSETGVVQSISSTNDTEYKAVYYNNGVIQHLSHDTLVKNQVVQYIGDYSTTGVLLKESWLKDGKPCATWREYDQAGVLAKTTRYPPITEAISGKDNMLVVLEEPPLFVTYVEALADYPGGWTALSKKLETDLIGIFCSSPEPLKGQYIIRFEVREDGTVGFLNITGWHAESVHSSVKNILQQLPRWKPGKYNGKTVTQILLLTLDFKAVKS